MASTLERLCALALMAIVPGCASEPRGGGQAPLFYASLAAPEAQVDPQTAAGMINLYRRNNGLGPLTVDPALGREARTAAVAMAANDKPASAEALKRTLGAAGVASPAVNVSAGYHTLAEAFSGWRESPVHNRTMLDAGGTRLGIATAYAPASKYKVYWVLIVAAPDGR